MDRMAERLAARPEVMDRRRESVEHPFGSIKQWMGQGAFLTRRARQRPRGVQPHRLGLQPATRDQSRGNSRDDCCGSGLNPCFVRFRSHNQP